VLSAHSEHPSTRSDMPPVLSAHSEHPSTRSDMPPVLGFLGVGTLNSAIVHGLCGSSNPPEHIVLSPRSKLQAEALACKFPDIVTIANSNQEVVDRADSVLVAVPASQAPEILAPLDFANETLLCSLVAGLPLSAVKSLCPSARSVVRAIPIPSVANGQGVTLIHPPCPSTAHLFDKVGESVSVQSEAELARLTTMACLMGAQYQWLQCVLDWMEQEGVDRENASKFIGAMAHSITGAAADQGGEGFKALVAEQTPGGVNETAIKLLDEAGVYQALDSTLDEVLKVLEPTTNNRQQRVRC